MMRRVFDTFPFAGELDLLEARLTELYDHVYRFVIVESWITYSGRPKPLWFHEHGDRFAPWKDKINHVVVDTGDWLTSSDRESAQRQAAWQVMDEFGDGDILIHGDADEIPHPGTLQCTGIKLLHRHHPVAVNLTDRTPWGGYVGHLGPGRPHMMELRQRLHSRIIPETQGSGWHFSWLGGPEMMKAKALTLCETDYLPKMVNGAEDLYRRRISPDGNQLDLAEIDHTWPRYMQDRRGPDWWYWPGPETS